MKEYNNKLNLKNESKNKKEISDTASQNVYGGSVESIKSNDDTNDTGYYSTYDPGTIFWEEYYADALERAENHDSDLAAQQAKGK